MPDLRTLMDEATQRQPAPDPVSAVHARVRRRAARRRATVAVATSSALVAAGFLYLGGPGRGTLPPAGDTTPTALSQTPSPPSSSPAPADPRWRLTPLGGGTGRPDRYDEDFAAVKNYVTEHPEVFGHLETLTEDGAFTTILSIARDADPGLWEARVRQRSGELPIRFERCSVTAATLDRVRAEVEAATWPSGTTLATDPYMLSDPGFGPCTMIVEVEREATPEDKAYARGRWGGVVGLVGSVVYPITERPRP